MQDEGTMLSDLPNEQCTERELKNLVCSGIEDEGQMTGKSGHWLEG